MYVRVGVCVSVCVGACTVQACQCVCSCQCECVYVCNVVALEINHIREAITWKSSSTANFEFLCLLYTAPGFV